MGKMSDGQIYAKVSMMPELHTEPDKKEFITLEVQRPIKTYRDGKQVDGKDIQVVFTFDKKVMDYKIGDLLLIQFDIRGETYEKNGQQFTSKKIRYKNIYLVKSAKQDEVPAMTVDEDPPFA